MTIYLYEYESLLIVDLLSIYEMRNVNCTLTGRHTTEQVCPLFGLLLFPSPLLAFSNFAIHFAHDGSVSLWSEMDLVQVKGKKDTEKALKIHTGKDL